MRYRSLIIGCIAILSWVFAVSAQTGGAQQAAPQPRTPQPAPATAAAPAQVRPVGATATTPSAVSVDQLRTFFTQTCAACHNERMAAAGRDEARKLKIDTLDVANVDKDRKTWELIVRKVRAGQMPPAGTRRPEPQVMEAHIAALESELDRTASPFAPPPGLHRLNRTEYANVVR